MGDELANHVSRTGLGLWRRGAGVLHHDGIMHVRRIQTRTLFLAQGRRGSGRLSKERARDEPEG